MYVYTETTSPFPVSYVILSLFSSAPLPRVHELSSQETIIIGSACGEGPSPGAGLLLCFIMCVGGGGGGGGGEHSVQNNLR